MRPFHRYEFHFAHPETSHIVKLYAIGETPCRAKNMGFDMLQKYVARSPELKLPENGWGILYQEDCGVVE